VTSNITYVFDKESFPFDTIVETGFGRGDTIIDMSPHVDRIITIEMNSESVLQMLPPIGVNFVQPPNSTILWGTHSPDGLQSLDCSGFGRTMWWLDAHGGVSNAVDRGIEYDSKRYPLADELEVVLKNRSGVSSDCILCDDYLMLRETFPLLASAVDKCLDKYDVVYEVLDVKKGYLKINL